MSIFSRIKCQYYLTDLGESSACECSNFSAFVEIVQLKGKADRNSQAISDSKQVFYGKLFYLILSCTSKTKVSRN